MSGSAAATPHPPRAQPFNEASPANPPLWARAPRTPRAHPREREPPQAPRADVHAGDAPSGAAKRHQPADLGRLEDGVVRRLEAHDAPSSAASARASGAQGATREISRTSPEKKSIRSFGGAPFADEGRISRRDPRPVTNVVALTGVKWLLVPSRSTVSASSSVSRWPRAGLRPRAACQRHPGARGSSRPRAAQRTSLRTSPFSLTTATRHRTLRAPPRTTPSAPDSGAPCRNHHGELRRPASSALEGGSPPNPPASRG